MELKGDRPFPEARAARSGLTRGHQGSLMVTVDGYRQGKDYGAYVKVELGIGFEDRNKRWHDRTVVAALEPATARWMAAQLLAFAEYVEKGEGEVRG